MIELSQQQIDLIELEISRQPQAVQDHYWMMVLDKKQSPRFAAMCAMRVAPGTKYSDRTFNIERRDAFARMPPKMRDTYLRWAKQAGVDTTGKFYVSGLGRPTDPMAWVSTVDDAKEVCKRKNLNADGIVKHEATPAAGPPPRTPMAPDIKRRLVSERLRRDPALAEACAKSPKKKRDIEAEVVSRHGSSGILSER